MARGDGGETRENAWAVVAALCTLVTRASSKLVRLLFKGLPPTSLTPDVQQCPDATEKKTLAAALDLMLVVGLLAAAAVGQRRLVTPRGAVAMSSLPPPRVTRMRSTACGSSALKAIQPPNGSVRGTPSRVTSVRPAPDGAIARRLMPWVVGLEARLDVRRNSDTAGTVARASSSRLARSSTCGSSRMTEKAASPAAGGSRAAVTTTSPRSAGA
jgi:hypothetical protein